MASEMRNSETYRRTLKIVHLIDRIRDDYSELRDILRRCLKTVIKELGCRSAFVQYVDFYDQVQSLTLDDNGLICHDFDDLFYDFYDHAANTRKTFMPDPKITDTSLVVTPLVIQDKLIGILGVEQSDQPEAAVRILIENVAMILDTTILHKCKEAFVEDQKKVMHAIDEIIDCNLDDFNKCQEAILRKLADISETAAALLFEGTERDPFGLVAANDLGKIIWSEYPQVVLEIKKAVQETMEGEKVYIRSFAGTESELTVAGSPVVSIGAFPLITAGGNSGGILATVSYRPLSKGHLELIEAGCSVLDTNLVRGKRTEMMMKRYKKYVGTGTLNVLLENPEWLNARKENVAILSADLVGSTEYASREKDAFKTFNLVNKYLKIVARTVMDEFNGTLDKFIGDEVMALFGAPVKDHRAPALAAECALRIREKVLAFNVGEKAENRPTFDMKITLGFSEAIIGEVGSEDTQTDYTALGDGVNQVFRMSKFGTPNEIVINEQLKEQIESDFEVEYIKDVQLRGIKEPKAMYRLIAKQT